jgi:tetratricopeptide (TPR) repeat protein/TolB-like protein
VLAARELVVDAPVLPPGATVGPYRVVELLARGGMGDVYRASDSRLGRHVALKVLSAGRTGDPRRVERFLMEARVTALLDHPNVVRVYDVGRVDQQAYLVTELLDGETLRARIVRGRIDPDEVRRIALGVARGLAAAHATGLVHRDLKPENIFLTRSGETKLLDFGIAKLTQDDNVPDGASTLTGVVLGTAGYLAPEQVRGESVDRRADLFAFGALLFEMLTGTRAFVRDQVVDTLHSILHDPPSLNLEHRPGVPMSLAAIVGRLLQKTPSARFQSAAELIGALEDADVGRTRSWPARQMSRMRSGLERPIWKSVVAAAAVAGVALLGYSATRPATGITLAVLPFHTEAVADEQFARGLTQMFIDRLGLLLDFTVLPLSATERQAGRDPTIAGRALGATHVLTGSINRQGEFLGGTAYLVTVATDSRKPISVAPAGTRTYTLQQLIISGVIDELSPRLEEDQRKRLENVGTQSVPAWERQLMGRAWVRKPDPPALIKARDFFQAAINIDPEYADAYAGYAYALKRLPLVADSPPRVDFEKAKDAANQALRLDPANPEAKSVLGAVSLFYDWDYDQAVTYLKEAHALKPSDPDTWLVLAHVYSNTGEPDVAIFGIRQANRLDPLWPAPPTVQGEFLMHEGEYTQSLKQLDRTIEDHKKFWLPHLFRTFTLLALNRYQKAVDSCNTMNALRKDQGMQPYSQGIALKAYALAKLGNKPEATVLFNELDSWTTAGKYVPQSLQALVLHALNRDAEAFARLRQAVREKDIFLAFIGVAPLWDDWRTLPEFEEALKATNLLEVSRKTLKSRPR